jgi:AhpD family alkylhydroperoxidase
VPTVLHVSPHPDDEALGAPATLLLLRRAGWRVVNLVTSLGRAGDAERRRAEAADAAQRAGFELVLPRGRGLTDEVASAVRSCSADVVVSPSSDDAHPGHKAVADATGVVLTALTAPPVWWQWALWADLRAPTLYVAFTEDVLEEARHVLRAYAGELARNDYDRLLAARATAQAVLGREGSSASVRRELRRSPTPSCSPSSDPSAALGVPAPLASSIPGTHCRPTVRDVRPCPRTPGPLTMEVMETPSEVIEQLRVPTRELRHAMPETWSAFTELHGQALRDGALPGRVKELMALAISVVKCCDGCIAHHARAAARLGATPDEIAETLGVALLMDGGPATVHGPRAWQAYREFAEQELRAVADSS